MNDEIEPEVSPDLLHLNVYCWVYILEFLDLVSLLNVARVSSDFRHLIRTYATSIRGRCILWCEMKLLEIQQLKDYFDLFGRNVFVIKACTHRKCLSENWILRQTLPQMYGDYIGQYCNNLEEILWMKIEVDILRQLVTRCKHLTRICLVDSDITDEDVLIFCDLPNLKSLEFCGINKMRGTHLYKLQQLNRLGIGSYMILPENVLKLCKSYGQNLIYLDIHEVCFWPSDDLNEVLNYCPHLEWAKLSIGHVIESSVPKLKGIHIDETETPVNGTLYALARTQAKSIQVLRYNDMSLRTSMQEIADSVCHMYQLRELSCTLDDKCLYRFHSLQNLQYLEILFSDDVTNNGILHIIKHCRNLYILGLNTCEKSSITEQLIFDAIDILLEQQRLDQRTAESLPMWLLLNKDKINDNILKDARYESARSALRIRYGRNIRDLLRHELKSIYKVFSPGYDA